MWNLQSIIKNADALEHAKANEEEQLSRGSQRKMRDRVGWSKAGLGKPERRREKSGGEATQNNKKRYNKGQLLGLL